MKLGENGEWNVQHVYSQNTSSSRVVDDNTFTKEV